jgi:proline iminopeptidase
MYPAIEPYDSGMLAVGDGNALYWETCGNAGGVPAVVLHGGPGSGCTSAMRRFFDPSAYRVVLFDQRQCGRSTPHASDPATDLGVNTTAHLLADMELLRSHLAVDRWLIFGVSWGTTLGLAYAERHPELVRALVLSGVALSTHEEIESLYANAVVEAYWRRLNDPDADERATAAREWTEMEWSTSSVTPTPLPPGRWSDPSFQLARARIVTHYFRHNVWLEDGALLRGAAALSSVPGVMINGRHDLQTPLAAAEKLAHAWPGGELVVVGEAGHSTGDPGMADAIVAATDRFARR